MTIPTDPQATLLHGLEAIRSAHAHDPDRHGLEALTLLRAAGLTWRDMLGEPFAEDDYSMGLLRYGHTPHDPAVCCGRAVMYALAHARPSDLATAAVLVNRPDQTADRADFQRALITVAEKGGVEQLRGVVGKATVKEIDDNLDDKMAAFKATTIHNRDAVRMYDTYRDSVKTLAYYKAMQGSSTPLEDAYQGILGKKFDFDGTMRVPKDDMPAVRTARQAVLGALTVADMPVLASKFPGLTDGDKRQAMFNSVRAFGQWVPSPDDGGLELIVRTNNNQIVRVSRADGTPVAVRFDKLQSYAAFGESDLGEVLRTGP